MYKAKKPKYLVLGAMPKDADPDEHIAAGEWCFLENQEHFPNWAEAFEVAPSFKPCKQEEAKFIDLLSTWGETLVGSGACTLSSSDPSCTNQFVYSKWTVTILPFLGYAHSITNILIDRYGSLELIVTGREASLETENISDFFRHLVSGELFAVILSRIIHMKLQTTKWVLCTEVIEYTRCASNKMSVNQVFLWLRGKFNSDIVQPYGIRYIIYTLLLQLIPSLDLPFCGTAYTTRFQNFIGNCAILFSSLLQYGKRGNVSNVFSGCRGNKIINKSIIKEFDYLKDIFWETLPRTHKNLPASYKRKRCFIKMRQECGSLQDSTNKILNYATSIHNGCKIFVVQHAPCYILLERHFSYAQELLSHAWISCGKNNLHKNSIKCFPQVRLQQQYNSYDFSADHKKILFITDNQRPLNFANDYTTWSTIRENIENYKIFLFSVNARLAKNILIRPYPSGNGSFEIEKWEFLKKYQFDTTNIWSLLLSSRIIIVDYVASTLGVSLVLNVPTIFIWTGKTFLYYEELVNAGILQTSHIQAAKFINENYDTIFDWWHSEKVQTARKLFLEQDTFTWHKNPNFETFKLLFSLK